MEHFATLFAGIGLFFIGVTLLSNHLRQLIGPTARALVARATASEKAAALLGFTAGAVTQSINAVIFILISLVSTGVMDVKRAHPVINWANLGTATLVLLAVLNLKLLVMVLVGLTGLAFYFGLDKSRRYGHLVGALLGIGLLFLGVDFIKTGAEPLKEMAWVESFLLLSAESMLIAFLAGLLLTLLTQSASSVTILGMTLATAGVMDLSHGLLLVAGAGLGSGVNTLLMAHRFDGLARQLGLYQMALKSSGTILMLLLLAVEFFTPIPLIQALLELLTSDVAFQIALAYVLFQLICDLAMHPIHHPVHHFLERISPPTPVESLGKPRYLYQQGLNEPSTALVLVEKEQQRLLAWLPQYLDELREGCQASHADTHALHQAGGQVARECGVFINTVLSRDPGEEVSDRAIILKARNDLIINLQNTLFELTEHVRVDCRDPEVSALVNNLAESLHLLTSTLSEAQQTGDADDLALLNILTHDRSEMMQSIRNRLLASSSETQHSVFAATSLFERVVWLSGQYVTQLENDHSLLMRRATDARE